MLINGTLIVQLVNFIIVYCVLRFLFFKPVHQIIAQEDLADKKQHDALRAQKEKMAQHVAVKREEWQACQHYFRQHSPSAIKRYEFEKNASGVVVGDISQSDIQTMREEIKKLILTKVEHV